MKVTIISDASFCEKTKAAGYGIWIKSNRGHFKGGGNYKNFPSTVEIAEGEALCIAVFIAFKMKISQAQDELILQTDSLSIVNALNGFTKSKRALDRVSHITKYINEICKANKCTWKVKHVQGHRKNLAAKNYCNHICDTFARQYMIADRLNKTQPREEIT